MVPPPSFPRWGHGGGGGEDPEGEGGGGEARRYSRLSLSAAFLCAAGGRAVAYRVCALPPPPLGGESDKDRRPDDKSFMVLRPHVDGGRRRT